MKQSEKKPILLLDEAVYGLDVYFNDAGYEIRKVPQGVNDSEVVTLARNGDLVVITPDNKLASRLRLQSLKCIDISFEAMFPTILEKLRRIS